MDMDVAYIDLQGLYEDLEAAIGGEADRVFEEIIDTLADEIAELAQEYAPVDTGELRDSIEVEKTGRLERRIIAKAAHGIYMEYGTGLRGEFPGSEYVIEPRNAEALAFDMNGNQVFASRVIHPGVAPRPFMRPAMLTAVEPLEELIYQGVIRLIVDTDNARNSGNEKHQYDKIELPDEYGPEVVELFDEIDRRGINESYHENERRNVRARRTGSKR